MFKLIEKLFCYLQLHIDAVYFHFKRIPFDGRYNPGRRRSTRYCRILGSNYLFSPVKDVLRNGEKVDGANGIQ
jgi:hypothetical protein